MTAEHRERAVLELGAAAEKWAEKIRSPKSRLDKLGVKAGQAVSVIGPVEEGFRDELRARVGAFAEEFLQLVIADAAMALGGTDAGFIEGASELFDDGTVDEWDVLFEARRVAELEGGDDAGCVVAVALADADAVGVREQVL